MDWGLGCREIRVWGLGFLKGCDVSLCKQLLTSEQQNQGKPSTKTLQTNILLVYSMTSVPPGM